MRLLKLELDIDSIIIGERVKGGIYRPCLETIPSSTVNGVFRYYLGEDLLGVGYFEKGTYEIKDFTYSVKDKYLGVAKMPFTSSYLCPAENKKIKAKIYLVNNNSVSQNVFQNLTLTIGALKNKGFGKAKVINTEEVESEIRQGILKVRIFEDDASLFGVKVLSPVYGYLFCVKNIISGTYKRALFEGSLVNAPDVFLEEEATFYDE